MCCIGGRQFEITILSLYSNRLPRRGDEKKLNFVFHATFIRYSLRQMLTNTSCKHNIFVYFISILNYSVQLKMFNRSLY